MEKRRVFGLLGGTYWSQDVLDAAKEKQVFCVGSTDILAAAQDKWRHRIQSNGQVLDDEEKERNTREHISDLTNQIASAAATAHIEQTKMLFDPIFREVERSFNNVQKLQRRHDRCLEETRQQRKLQETAGTACEGQADYSIETSFNRANHPVHEVDRLQRKRQLVLAAKVPWHLLDQLEAERRNLAHEKAMLKLWGKANVGE
ncbi:unnamed protein product [Phytophthora lilii]|uniref:Unnamed protein product n=1 Tax=Phytophthora lilii TaxID=2077276 RepID=A0A9W6TMF3_9STRA|nr:unnamed protein product [Phytophthora lilii]